MGQFAYDVDASNFREVVIEGSKKVPVLVDFWAEWCGPCKVLKPILEKLADEYGGKFILAKVDSDRNQGLAAQFGVRGIPSVKAFVGGKLIDEFSGALPESVVRQFLDRLIPSPADELRAQAAELRAAGDTSKALQVLAEASRLDTGNETVRIDAAEILLDLDQNEDAQRLLDSLSPDTRSEDRVQQLLARLAFAAASPVDGDEADLRTKLAADPDDMETRWQLANLLVAGDRHAEGLDELIDMVRRNRNWNDDAARKQVLAVFNLLGGQGEIVSAYRRKLASALN